MHIMKTAKKAVAKATIARKKAAAKKKARVSRNAVARPKSAAVTAARDNAQVPPQSALREEYTIEARNFGPIAEAKLNLKPLTVLIGPSNTGKTYMATLACMMMKKHMGFVQGVRPNMMLFTNYENIVKESKVGEFHIFANKLGSAIGDGSSAMLSNMPDKLQKLWRPMMRTMFKDAWKHLGGDMKNFYGVSDLSHLVARGGRGPFECKYRASIDGDKIADVRIKGFKKKMNIEAAASDFRFPVSPVQMSGLLSDMNQASKSRIAAPQQKSAAAKVISVIHGMLQYAATNPSAHFLPASRGGLIKAQRVMSIAMMRIGGRAGRIDIPNIPTLSQLDVDFLEDIDSLLSKISSPNSRKQFVSKMRMGYTPQTFAMHFFASRPISESSNVVEKIENFLGGQIVPKQPDGNESTSLSPPISTMGYHPRGFADAGINVALDMAQSSSMVGQIAPLVLYLKGGIEQGDTLFIEEPEAHLHPAAQAKMAEILSAMVRAGIRVIVTTHSDWLLSSIANIVRRGELGEGGEEEALTKKQVGIWLFDRGKKSGGAVTRELTFDSVTGYIPDNLRDLSDDLHNETADLLDAMDAKRSKAAAKKAK